MQFTGERVIDGSAPKRIWLDHVARYEFAGRYVKKGNVLDIACGTGYGSKILRDAGAEKVIGVDISSEAIGSAFRNYKINGLEFTTGDILDIDFQEKSFDMITCFETIEHVQDQKRALEELHRVLSPEGLLIISSPNRKMTSPLKSICEPPDNPFHVVEYTMEEFFQLLEEYFEILAVFGQRGIGKLFFLPFFERMMKRILPMMFYAGFGNSELEKVSSKKEYRYVTAICKKSNRDDL
jgi:ubiquinone/menaquinone biosynthesis C-methylase UbiE